LFDAGKENTLYRVHADLELSLLLDIYQNPARSNNLRAAAAAAAGNGMVVCIIAVALGVFPGDGHLTRIPILVLDLQSPRCLALPGRPRCSDTRSIVTTDRRDL
jgi:hypothetical protein